MTPDEYLNQIITLWTPPRDDRSAVSLHRERIEQHLRSTLGITRMRETGSWHHGTAIQVTSDVDYFVTMPGPRPTNSQTSLDALRAALQRGFPNAAIYEDRPAISVHISADVPQMEVVPAFYRTTDDYDIPDPTGSGWIRSNPTKHLEYVNEAQRRDGKAKSLIRLMKTWRQQNRLPISSFYLEMRTAKQVLDSPPVIYLWDMRDTLQGIANSGLAAMNDPSDYDGRRIQPGPANANEHAATLAAITDAARLARLAKDANDDSNPDLAVYYIQQIMKF